MAVIERAEIRDDCRADAAQAGRPEYQVRVIEERYELSERLGRLQKFISIGGPAWEELSDTGRALLVEQAGVMKRLVRVLDRRIEDFDKSK